MKMASSLCSNCYEVDPDYHEDDDGRNICDSCKGTVLSIQEAADLIAELKSKLRPTDEEYSEE